MVVILKIISRCVNLLFCKSTAAAVVFSLFISEQSSCKNIPSHSQKTKQSAQKYYYYPNHLITITVVITMLYIRTSSFINAPLSLSSPNYIQVHSFKRRSSTSCLSYFFRLPNPQSSFLSKSSTVPENLITISPTWFSFRVRHPHRVQQG